MFSSTGKCKHFFSQSPGFNGFMYDFTESRARVPISESHIIYHNRNMLSFFIFVQVTGCNFSLYFTNSGLTLIRVEISIKNLHFEEIKWLTDFPESIFIHDQNVTQKRQSSDLRKAMQTFLEFSSNLSTGLNTCRQQSTNANDTESKVEKCDKISSSRLIIICCREKSNQLKTRPGASD